MIGHGWKRLSGTCIGATRKGRYLAGDMLQLGVMCLLMASFITDFGTAPMIVST